MYVMCDACGYDSGDKDTPEELAEKVRADGGHMDKFAHLRGWTIVCPKGHDGDAVHMD